MQVLGTFESHEAFQPSWQQFWKMGINMMLFACSASSEMSIKIEVLRDLKAGKTFSHSGVSLLFGPLIFQQTGLTQGEGHPWLIQDSWVWWYFMSSHPISSSPGWETRLNHAATRSAPVSMHAR